MDRNDVSTESTKPLVTGSRPKSDTLRVFGVGVLAYISPSLAIRYGALWFSELADHSEWIDRFRILRRKYWRAFFTVSGVAVLALGTALALGHHPTTPDKWLRILAATLALTATLGRGGWAIQSFKGATIVERIDRGMYVLSQLGATVILLLLLAW